MKYLLLAFSFLTVIPVNLKGAINRGDIGRSAVWFPLIGIFIGGISALVWLGSSALFSPLLASVLAAAVWILMSGGLHLDGLADCCDGMLHASNPSRRLEIMKDPRLGTFGGIGLILAVLLKVAMLNELSPSVFIWLPLAAGMGRWMLLPMGKQPLAREGGMGADFAAGLSKRVFFAAALPLLAFILLAGWRGIVAGLVAHALGWVISRFARSRLGGITGDVLGLTVECVEILVLLVACI
jgi:adenosylcobinamide-GDP ribazoletransferase